jgi:hypothetical protein
MPLKTSRLTILVTPSAKKAFEAQCRSDDSTPSQVVRSLIREYIGQAPGRRETAARKPPAGRRTG